MGIGAGMAWQPLDAHIYMHTATQFTRHARSSKVTHAQFVHTRKHTVSLMATHGLEYRAAFNPG